MKSSQSLYQNFSINIPVRYREPGNVVANVLITFALRCGSVYCSARPLCNSATRRLLNLPERFIFDRINGRALVQPGTLGPVVRKLMKFLSGKPGITSQRSGHGREETMDLL